MFDINEIFNKLKAGIKVPQEFSFLQKYDKDKNSVFNENEIAQLKNDISIFAAKNDSSELSQDEIEDFYKSKIMQNNSYNHNEINTIYGWLYSLSGENSQMLNDIHKTKEYKKSSKDRKQFIDIMAQNLMRFGEEIYAKDFISHNSAEYTEDDIKKLLPVIQKLNRIPMFQFGDKWQQQLKEYIDVSEQRINEIINREYYFSIDTLLKLNDTDFKKITQTIDGTIYKPSESEIELLLSLSDEKLVKLKKFLVLPEIAQHYLNDEIKRLVELDDTQYRRMVEVINKIKNNQPLNIISVIDISSLSENEFDKAIDLLNQNITTKSGEEPISLETAFYMSKLDDKEQENYRKLGSLGVFHMDQLYNLAKCKSDELYNFMANANNIEDIKVNVRFGEFSSVAIKCKDGKTYIFDSNGEQCETWVKKTNPENPQGLIIEVTNTKLNIKQRAIYDVYNRMYSESYNDCSKLETEYYDNKGALVKTVNTVKSELEGVYNKSETYPDGRVVPLQHVYYNPQNGETVISNNMVSPAGIRTEYHFEKSPDNTEIVNYKITDKNSNILLNWENTHQKISENEYISSSNGQVYKVVYDDMKIYITDNNGKSYTVDLNNKLGVLNREFLMSALKSLPADQLLALNKFPIHIIYDQFDNVNSHWDAQSEYISMGNHTSTEEQFLSVFKHEFGHYIDSRPDGSKSISENKELEEISKKEHCSIINSLSVLEQEITGHLIGDGLSDPMHEGVAEAIMLLSCGEPFHQIRALNYMEFFPERIAKTAQLFEQRMKEITED